MNNESIKKILDYLKDDKWNFYPSDGTPYKVFFMEERDILLDYITYLQQRIEYLERSNNRREENITSLQDECIELEEENEKLKMNNPEQNMEHFRVIKENKLKINNLRKQVKDLQQELDTTNEKWQKDKQFYNCRLEENVELRKELERYKHYSKTTGIEELMQENESLQENNQSMQEEMARVWEENERLKDELERLHNLLNSQAYKDLEDYKSRVDKAIPKLKELNIKIKDILKIGIDIKEISDIEELLQGGKDDSNLPTN